jgi:hypothetical protein
MGAGNGVWSRFSGVKPPLAVEAVNVSAASLFRKASDTAGLPTILYDEIDCVFGLKPKENEDLHGLLHAEHRRGAMAGRCMVRGRIVETEELPAFCAVALAGLGNLPDTILTRSVIIQMRRRAPHEHVEPFAVVSMLQKAINYPNGLAEWAAMVRPDVNLIRNSCPPSLPCGLKLSWSLEGSVRRT